ncbi:hypothetical protein VTN77DRAFT_1855 [Rasamsonia byssochlamydoides]|uniref:uncharacterized protein n=1 Tax=Rasamsonia byssochlamydoides TaxID=89139 RepID=UPI00374326C1
MASSSPSGIDTDTSPLSLSLSWLQETVDILRTKLAAMDQQQVFFSLAMLVVLLVQVFWKAKQARNVTKTRTLEAPGFPPIEPLKNFDWKTTEPLKFRPFKPKYHLTMALETLNPSELIPMDKTYKDRLAYRRSLLKEYHDTVVAVNDDSDPRIRAAVKELYTFLMGTYLPGRYPTMFRLHHTAFETGKAVMLENLVTEEIYPAEVTPQTSTIRALETLLKTIDEDFLILLPEEPKTKNSKNKSKPSEEKEAADGNVKYILQAFSTCYPAGFNPRKKLGKRLAEIHAPVPGYADKLEKSMDRFFEKLEVGRYVKRVNWSITTDAELFSAFGGLHSEEGEKMDAIKPGELNVDTTFLRCERQTLHRLPCSKALVFAFHTYTYPIREIKEEGLGEDLATAIDGLKEGSTPQIHFYKRGPVWGEAVKAFLRS